MDSNLKVQRQVGLMLAGVAQRIEHQPVNQKVTYSLPSQGTCLGCRSPVRGMREATNWCSSRSIFLSLSFSLPSAVSENKDIRS